ncbi:MAG TPA: hypothetical protein PLU30_12450 [Verrucomicrobiae bacterium]|nr:hypothetical protein [Verrucomicrobiae bacterium]
MKKTLLVAALAMALAPIGSAITCNWSNSLGDNNFGSFSNWFPVPTTFQGNAFNVNLAGANRAVISTTLHSSVKFSGGVRTGTQAGKMGELLVSEGTNTFGDVLYVGQVFGSTGLFTLTGGLVEFPSNFTTIAESTNMVGTFAMSGGTFRGDRLTAATSPGATGTVIITGGEFILAETDPSPAGTSGYLRMGEGNAQIHIGGTAQVTVEFLLLGRTNNGPPNWGIMTMSNGVLNIIGNPNTNAPPINFCPGRTVDFEGGVWNVFSNVTTVIQQAISAGLIYHSAGNDRIRVTYNSTNDTTVVKIQQPTALESWRFQYFGTTEDTGNAANTADPEQDGIPNLIEFAFGLHPLQCNAGQLPKCTVSGGNLTIEFPEPNGVSGITYGAESSTNLINWAAVTNSGTGTTNTFTVFVGSQPKGFLRLLAIEQ